VGVEVVIYEYPLSDNYGTTFSPEGLLPAQLPLRNVLYAMCVSFAAAAWTDRNVMHQYDKYILQAEDKHTIKIMVNDTCAAHADAAFVKLLSARHFKQITIGGGLTAIVQPNVCMRIIASTTGHVYCIITHIRSCRMPMQSTGTSRSTSTKDAGKG